MTLREIVEAWHQEVAGYSGASCDEAYEFAVRVEQAAFEIAAKICDDHPSHGGIELKIQEAIRELAKERANDR